jgi:hypothetical protein
MSVGVRVLRVWPSKSLVTLASATPAASAGLLAERCRSTVAALPVALTKSGTAALLALSWLVAARQAASVARSAEL